MLLLVPTTVVLVLMHSVVCGSRAVGEDPVGSVGGGVRVGLGGVLCALGMFQGIAQAAN